MERLTVHPVSNAWTAFEPGVVHDCDSLRRSGVIAPLCLPLRSNPTAYLRTEIMDFRGFDSKVILIVRGGILMSIGNFPEMLSQQILAEVILVG